MPDLLRFKDFQGSEAEWLRSERARLTARIVQLNGLLDDLTDEVADMAEVLESYGVNVTL